MNELFSAEGAISLASLAAMEIVLGIDNIIFIAILSQKVALEQQKKVRRLGLMLALFMRLGLLFTLSWIMGLKEPLFSVLGKEISGRDLVLLGGGLFLMFKSTREIYEKVEGGHGDGHGAGAAGSATFAATIVQILLLDIVFSLDSVITAVGMVPHVSIMATAMVIAVVVMLIFADRVSEFITRHPSMKILALSFLLTIGLMLVAEGFGKHIEKGYIYFAMAFSLLIEILNMRFRRKQTKPAVGPIRAAIDNVPPT